MDDILLTLYNMAAVDFQGFFNYVPELLENIDLLSSSQRETLEHFFNRETVSVEFSFMFYAMEKYCSFVFYTADSKLI